MLAPSCRYVGLIFALGCSIVSRHLPEVDRSFSPFRGTPWTAKARKTRGFLIVPSWHSRTANATKDRKTQGCFLTPRAKKREKACVWATGGKKRPPTILFFWKKKMVALWPGADAWRIPWGQRPHSGYESKTNGLMCLLGDLVGPKPCTGSNFCDVQGRA